MPYILSPEQKVIVDALMTQDNSTTKYFDVITALQSIHMAISSAVEKGQKILVQLPNEEVKTMFNSMCKETGLDDLCINVSNTSPIPELDIIKLRSNLKKEIDSDAIIKHVLAAKKSKTELQKIIRFYSSFEHNVLADSKFKDFTTNVIYKKQKNRPQLNLNAHSEALLTFNESEFYSIRKEISIASQLYQKQFELFDHVSLFTSELWSDLDDAKVKAIQNQLSELRNECDQLSIDFIQTINDLRAQISLDQLQDFQSLENRFEFHESACLAYHIKVEHQVEEREGKFSLFKKKKAKPTNKTYVEAFDELSEQIQKISQKWYDELDAPTTEMITFDFIQSFISKNSDRSIHYKKEVTNFLHSSIQRVNKINTESEVVKALDLRLESLIQKMNQSGIFDLEIEHNILSFVKQSDLCESIRDYIEKCCILFHSSSQYLKWKSFYNTTDTIFTSLFHELKKLPKDQWNYAFEHWYEQRIQSNILGDNHVSANDLHHYFKLLTVTLSHEVPALVAKHHKQRIQAVDELKANSRELYNTLFKKKQMPSTSWSSTVLMNRSFLQDFFPIHMSDNNTHSKEYDMVISFGTKEEDSEDSVHYFAPIEKKDIEEIAQKKFNFLYLNEYQYQLPLHQLSSTDKLKASKKLAKYILSLNQQIKIYQLKNANIISLLPTYDDSFLEQQLDFYHVKTIDTQGVLYDRLTESILFTDRTPFLLIKDNLINSELHEHLQWQLKIIQLFKDVGYTILSLDTVEQLKNNRYQFDSLLHKLGCKGPEKQEVLTNEEAPKSNLTQQV
ncbi:MAG: hypothetical protein P1U56_16435 [Saprospiraceae bacterium]|nr:hypothetical protein [Saprospiraceae bacterium]